MSVPAVSPRAETAPTMTSAPSIGGSATVPCTYVTPSIVSVESVRLTDVTS